MFVSGGHSRAASLGDLGAVPPLYAAWVSEVKRRGGAVVGFPDKSGRSAARYPEAVYLANRKAWGAPDRIGKAPTAKGIEYARGKFTPSVGYYLAPASVQSRVAGLTKPTPAEIAVNAKKLEKRWDPLGLGKIGRQFHMIVLTAVVGAFVVRRVLK